MEGSYHFEQAYGGTLDIACRCQEIAPYQSHDDTPISSLVVSLAGALTSLTTMDPPSIARIMNCVQDLLPSNIRIHYTFDNQQYHDPQELGSSGGTPGDAYRLRFPTDTESHSFPTPDRGVPPRVPSMNGEYNPSTSQQERHVDWQAWIHSDYLQGDGNTRPS